MRIARMAGRIEVYRQVSRLFTRWRPKRLERLPWRASMDSRARRQADLRRLLAVPGLFQTSPFAARYFLVRREADEQLFCHAPSRFSPILSRRRASCAHRFMSGRGHAAMKSTEPTIILSIELSLA